MKKSIQQFMLGTVTNSLSQAESTLRAIREAGYAEIELCAFMTQPTPALVRLLTKAAGMSVGRGGKLPWESLIKDSGLGVTAIHQYLPAIEEDMEKCVADCRRFGTERLVITGMYRFDYRDREKVLDLAARLNKAGEALRKEGIRLLYHNHNFEFLPIEPGLWAYRLLQRETSPENLGFEFDSYWCADAGRDPLREMEALGSRMELWHVADRGCRKPGFTPICKMDTMEPGTGTMDIAALGAQAAANGTAAAVLECHKNWIDGDPIASLRLSAKAMNF